MSNNLKISEGEFSIYKNKISTYCDFLSESIDSYIAVLDEVLSIGINDVKITNAITDLKTRIKPIAENLESSSSSVNSSLSIFLSDVESEDKFNYSDEGMSSIFSILSMFLGG